MKTKIIDEPEVEKEVVIDWDKEKQLMISDNQIVLTTGGHSDTTFSGINLSTNEASNDWAKDKFTLLPSTKIVQLQND